MKEEICQIAYSNSFHDSSIAIAKNDYIFAEAFERSAQSKRTLWMMPLFYFYSSMKDLITKLQLENESKVLLLTTWKLSWVQILGAPLIFSYYWFKAHFRLVESFHQKKYQVEKHIMLSQLHNILHLPIFSFVLQHILFKDQVKELTKKAISHHLCHASNGVFTSPFLECVVMVLDGSGEKGGGAYYHFKDNQFKMIGECHYGLGLIYADVTNLCGFSPAKGEEWKVMGLAAYGKLLPEVYQFFKKIIVVNGIKYKYSFGKNEIDQLEILVGGFRGPNDPNILKAADLAHTFQQVFIEVVLEITKNLFQLGLSKNLVYVGGCALNSAANGLIVSETGFTSLHIPSAPGDDGNSLGALFYYRYIIEKKERTLKYFTPYLGRDVDLNNLNRILNFKGIRHEIFPEKTSLTKRIAELLSEGNIIGWMQGRAEFGPRALGNRSILADPRDPQMKTKINALVKFREDYRPLAPSILKEFGPSYFENYQDSFYMERTLKFKNEVKSKIPAVVHEDGTGRLQTVTNEMNPLFHQLISQFHEKTGIPLLVNTSLNIMGKPIVNLEEDALTLFFTTGLNYLVIGNVLFLKDTQ